MTSPRFKHDCSRCVFLGQDAHHDFYFCEQMGGLPTVSARYGNDGPEYSSGLEVARTFRRQLDFKYPLSAALTLAEEKGLVHRPNPVEYDDRENRIVVSFDSLMLKLGFRPVKEFSGSDYQARQLWHELEHQLMRSKVAAACVGLPMTRATMDAMEYAMTEIVARAFLDKKLEAHHEP